MKKIIVALVLVSTVMLSGCGLFHSDKAWEKAKQENPLEIPPNMDRPNVSDALTIPSVNADHATQAMASSSTPGALHLSGDVDSAYKRVGLALGNGDIGSVVSQSDSEHTYHVAMASKMQLGSSQGFMQRHFSNTQNKQAASGDASSSAAPAQSANVLVQVTAAPDGGSQVSASGDPQQVARLMNALKARLGG
jgi:uncharacterized lipoprotein